METELQVAKENAKEKKFWTRGHKEHRVLLCCWHNQGKSTIVELSNRWDINASRVNPVSRAKRFAHLKERGEFCRSIGRMHKGSCRKVEVGRSR